MTKKIAISVPDGLLARVDEASRQLHLPRSAVFAAAADRFLRDRRRREADERYVQSFRDLPESDAEMAELDSYVRSPRAWADDGEW